MQDDRLKLVTPNGGILVREEAPPGQLPPTFLTQLAESAAVILVQESETEGGKLSLVPILAGGQYLPESIASHALVAAITEALPQLVRRVMGHPTHADRYLAFQEFALMEHSDPKRYDTVNTMLQQFEEDNLKEGDKHSAEYMDKAADFLVLALHETKPARQESAVTPN